jgi:hypothetical protein
MVLYKLKVFCSDMKFKMAAMAGISLTLDPMGKMFQNAFSLKPLGQFKPNCRRMIIGRSSTKFRVFYAEWKSKMTTTAGNRLTLNPMRKVSQNASSLKPLGKFKPNCPRMIIGRSSTKFRFFMPIRNPRWPPP